MNNLFKKKKKKANNENKIIRMIKFENCQWQLNSTGSESDIDMIIFVYVTRISVIFIYALGFLFPPKKSNFSSWQYFKFFIFGFGDFIDELPLKKINLCIDTIEKWSRARQIDIFKHNSAF